MEYEKIILGVDPGTTIMGYGLLGVNGRTATPITMGVIDLRRISDMYLRLGKISERIESIIDGYLPDEMAIEAPFVGVNIQSTIKLGRAQGVAIAAAIRHQVPITEYAPMKIKMAITGSGSASKEQVAGMLQRLLHLTDQQLTDARLDATDALAAAYCHYLQLSRPVTGARHYSSWKDFAQRNSERVSSLNRNNTTK